MSSFTNLIQVLAVLVTSTAFKLLFVYSYHSTDFEVHRNWMAITHSLPLSRWYFESTSKWTLDYPPFFAWFEWLLSQIAVHIDPKMCVIQSSPYVSRNTILFQRLTVIVSELILPFSLWRLCLALSHKSCYLMKHRLLLTEALFAFNYGLILIDHIHFQYNGMLFGILLLSAAFLVEEKYIKAAVCFTFLLNLKHIFLYLAPVYFVYILFNYCFGQRKFIASLVNTSMVGIAVLGTTLLSFGPFLYTNQGQQVISRLFPFGRGLSHAYWAPNYWALYNSAEKLLSASNNFFHFWPEVNSSTASMTGGLVREFTFEILPNIRPHHTMCLSLLFMLPNLVRCARKSAAFSKRCSSDSYVEYLIALVAAAWSCFMFGWHVHEKAILMVLLPLNLLAMAVPNYRFLAFYATTLGHYSLIPLIPTKAEMPAVVSMFLAYTAIHWLTLFRLHPASKAAGNQRHMTDGVSFFRRLGQLHLWGLIVLFIFTRIIFPLTTWDRRLPFFPLMATSAYTALGLWFALLYFLSSTVLGSHSKSIRAQAQPQEQQQEKKNKKKLKTN